MSATVVSSELERRSLAKVRFYVLTYVVLGQILYQLCRMNIGFAQLTMGKELGLSAQAFGLAAGIFALSAFLMQVPAGVLLEKFGARFWLTFNMIAWGLVVVAQGFVANGSQLTILRFFLGIFEAGFLPGVYVIISVWFRGKNQGKATSWVQIGLALSVIFGGPFAGWILGKSFLGLSGWRSLFLIEGGITVIWAIATLRILSDDPSNASWLDPEEREFMTNYLGAYQDQKIANGAMENSTVLGALKDTRIIILTLSYVCAGWIAATFTFFTPTLLKTAGSGMSNQAVGFLSMGPYIVNALVAFTWGAHGDKTNERHWHTVLPLLVAAAGALLYPFAKAPMLAMLSLALVQAGNTGFFVNFWPTCNLVVGKKAITKTTAIINTGSQIGNFMAPVFFGWAKDISGSTKFGLYACIGVLLFNFFVMHFFFIKYTGQRKPPAGY